MIMTKNDIRKHAIAERRKLTEGELEKKSNIICRKLLDSFAYQNASIIMCYADFRNEVKTGVFIRECIKSGRRLALPVIESYNGIMNLTAYEIRDPDKDLIPGSYGILEPVVSVDRRVNEKSIDLVVIPGVAFDKYKNRLGYGAGFYDRFLRMLKPSCTKAGIGFDAQVFDKIPVEEHDEPMDLIVTESIIIY